MTKLLDELKKNYIVVKKNVEYNSDVIIILLNKITYAYVGSFKLDNNKKLIYNTDLINLTAYDIEFIGHLFVEYSNL